MGLPPQLSLPGTAYTRCVSVIPQGGTGRLRLRGSGPRRRAQLGPRVRGQVCPINRVGKHLKSSMGCIPPWDTPWEACNNHALHREAPLPATTTASWLPSEFQHWLFVTHKKNRLEGHLDDHSHKFLTEIRHKYFQIAPTGVKPSRIFHRQPSYLHVCRSARSDKNCGWQRPRTEWSDRITLLRKLLRPSVVGPLRIALSPCRIFCYGHGGYPPVPQGHGERVEHPISRVA